MKKYSKPVVHTDVINDINEPVLMSAFPSGWNESDCWTSSVYCHQPWEQTRQYFSCQGNAEHDSVNLGVRDGHINRDDVKIDEYHPAYGQFVIFEFDQALPVTQYGITGHINHYPLEFYLDSNGYATRARAVTNWHSNAQGEHVGMGNFEVYLSGVPANITSIMIREIMFADGGNNPYSGNAFRQF